MDKLDILLTNDDGPGVAGLSDFAEALKALGQVLVVVPDGQRSGVGHSMTLSEPLRVAHAEDGMYLASGFPADCVKYALCTLCDGTPDLVVSGINLGENTGVSVFYSGTIGGAREGALNGITSIAVSVADDCSGAEPRVIDLAMKVIRLILDQKVPAGSLFNVNIPSPDPIGTRVARQGLGAFQEELISETDADGGKQHWFSGKQTVEGENDTDVVFYRQGYVTVTPLCCDETDRDMCDRLGGSSPSSIPWPLI